MPKRSISSVKNQLTWPHPIQVSQWASLLFLCGLILAFGGLNVSSAADLLRKSEATQQLTITQLPPVPILKSKVSQVAELQSDATLISQVQAASSIQDPPLLSATSYYAFDIESQTQLAAKQENLSVPPASTTKLLTAIIALKSFASNQVFTVTTTDLFDNPLGFSLGEKITRDQLLAALLINSSNEAAYILADQYEGGVEGFVAEMNQVAQELGMNNSHFQNPAGFDDPEQISTARDLSVLARAAMKNLSIRQLVSQQTGSITDLTATRSHQLINTNRLLKEDATVIGIKTGTTEEAKEVLISQFVRDGHQIQLVVLGSQDRYADTHELLKWILDSYQWVLL